MMCIESSTRNTKWSVLVVFTKKTPGWATKGRGMPPDGGPRTGVSPPKNVCELSTKGRTPFTAQVSGAGLGLGNSGA